jgi:hypothetical protein
MVSDAETRDLKDAYEFWQSSEVLFEYGPLRAYAPIHHGRIQALWREIIDPAVKLVAQTEVRTAAGEYETRAPSPWHAYFYLRAQQQYLYRAGRPFSVSATDRLPGQTGPEHLFFRGQRCSSWDFTSSLQRKDEATRRVEDRAVVALTEYFRSLFVANEDVASNTARCFAQHYGIATSLADISCEPDIAVWFATHPHGAPCPTGDPDGTVRAVTWAGQQQEAETVFLLPPPFVRNLYEQRGLFIDTSKTDGVLTGKLILQVAFPRDTAAGEFQVRRRNNVLAVWPPPDAPEQELVDWSRRIATDSTDDDDVRNKVTQAKHDNALPEFWLERELWDKDNQIRSWLPILNWVLPATCITALPVGSGSGPMRYEILDPKLRALVRANPSFFRAFVEASEDSDFTGFEVLHEVLRFARTELGI